MGKFLFPTIDGRVDVYGLVTKTHNHALLTIAIASSRHDSIGMPAIKIGDVSPNRRKFRQDKFSPATIASRSITCPLSRKV